MNGFLLFLHILVSVLLIGGILLQPGSKGGGMGAMFGGGGAHTAFGAQGAAPFLAKATYVLAAFFMMTSLGIELYIIHKSRILGPSKPAVTAPATPAGQAPAAPAGQAPAAPAPAPAPAPAGK